MIYDPYSKNMNCRVFDIETTGLSPAMDMIVSASFIDPDGSRLTQYFTDDPASEYITVTRILEELSGCDAVITYNGNSFDLPFIYSRARKLCITGPRHFLRKIDIYRWLKSYWQLAPSMESLRQVAVEEALGLSECRTDRISGGECIPLYSDYLSRGTEKSKELILLHNADDVRQLAAITQKLSFLPYHRIAFENGFMTKANSFGLLGNCEYRILGGPAELKGGHLKLKARIDPPCMPTAYYEDGFRLQSDGKGSAELDVFCGMNGSLIYADINKLPVESSAFEGITGFDQGLLMLSYNDEINYPACNALAAQLLKTLA